MEEAVRSSYNWGGISRCLFEAFILVEGYNKGMERFGEAYLELLYWWRDLERPIWSIYISGGILRRLFQPIIFEEGCNKGWRELFGAVIIGERYGGSSLELL